ncbi:MAG: type II secretion system protein [Sandaracinaceae bacterium]|nr:type II secretion system protein [Sandaracinaceae bacterium]MBP7681255.1 type II secretion system protein [Deltaproteobacteria bacterium]MBK6808817.1 type II secretion system protein [Sandaracinaceae bacterium]MBK7150387.1 type II secretion system protein [Sandaracinaceae bacterium]MBK7777275.1 type II secretion system protein [Sandaracinaceae bacterium]
MRQRPNGWTVVEVSLVISVIATAAAMFLPAFFARLELSKFNEVDRELAQLARAVRAYYEESHSVRGSSRTRCLPASAGPTPAEVGEFPTEVDFADDATPGAATWRALGFQPPLPGRFRYTVQSSVARCGVRPPARELMVRVVAEADLDGDGSLSRFTREFLMGADGSLTEAPLLRVVNRTE